MKPYFRQSLLKWRDANDPPTAEERGKGRCSIIVIAYFERTREVKPVECMVESDKVSWYQVRSHEEIEPPTCYTTFGEITPPPGGSFDPKLWPQFAER